MLWLPFYFASVASTDLWNPVCAYVPKRLEVMMEEHIARIRAAEYCRYQEFKTHDGLLILIYTAEGACNNDKRDPPGSCSVSWVRYMIGIDKGVPIPPVAIGGKWVFSEERVTFADGAVKITGLPYTDADAGCCPSVPAVEMFRAINGRFVKVLP